MLILYSRSCELRRKLVLVVESFPTIERSQLDIQSPMECAVRLSGIILPRAAPAAP
jgi:hypothetical protein